MHWKLLVLKLSKSLEICHVLDGEIFLSMWCCRSLTDGTPSFEILYEGFRLCLCAASFVSILWTFLLDLELSETLDFSFAATQAVAGGAAEDLHDVNCNFQCLRHRDWRGEKLRGANQGFCDTSQGFLWTAGSEISSQLTAKMIQTTKMSVSHSLRTYGQALNREATEGPPDAVQSSLDEVLLWPLGTVTPYAYQWPSLRFASPPLQIPNPHLLSNPRSKKQSTICPLCGKLYLLPEVGQLVRVLLLY